MRPFRGVSCERHHSVRFPALGRSLQRLQHVHFLSPPRVLDSKAGDGNQQFRALAGDVAPPSPSEASDGTTQLRTGQVLCHDKNGVVLVQGLNDTAQMGTLVKIAGGAQGVLLWWHNLDVCSVLVTSYGDLDPESLAGTNAECAVASKPSTIPVPKNEDGTDKVFALEFEKLAVPAGGKLRGQVLDHLCRPLSDEIDAVGSSADATPVPLMNEQVAMGDREVISEPLFSGVLAVDVLTPLAHGCAMLATGPERAAVTDLVLRLACNLASADVHVIYAACCEAEALEARVAALRAAGALPHATVVAAEPGAPRAQQYAALCAAMAVGEAVRDGGGRAVVLCDSAECMVALWETAARMARGGGAEDAADEMVELDGMLVSAAAAERRKFLSALLQRAAKRRRDQGGGALSLVLGMLGVPASGDKTAATAAGSRAPKALDAYKHLSPELKAKMAAALAAKAAAAAAARVPQAGSPEHRATVLLEEFMSIADGQAVLQRGGGGARPLKLDCTTSLSRLGARAYPPALKDLAPRVRFELTQAVDAQRYAADGGGAAHAGAARRTALLEAALAEAPSGRCSLPEAAALLWLLVSGKLDGLEAEGLWDFWPGAWQRIEAEAADAVQHITETRQLTAESKAAIKRVVKTML